MRSPEGFAAILAALIKGDQQTMYTNIDCLSLQELEILDHAALQLSEVCKTTIAALPTNAAVKGEKQARAYERL